MHSKMELPRDYRRVERNDLSVRTIGGVQAAVRLHRGLARGTVEIGPEQNS